MVKCSFQLCLIFLLICRWYPLKCKPGQNKTDYRGDLEVRVAFTVKAVQNQDHGGSSASISNKNKHKGIFFKINFFKFSNIK